MSIIAIIMLQTAAVPVGTSRCFTDVHHCYYYHHYYYYLKPSLSLLFKACFSCYRLFQFQWTACRKSKTLSCSVLKQKALSCLRSPNTQISNRYAAVIKSSIWRTIYFIYFLKIFLCLTSMHTISVRFCSCPGVCH